MRLRVHDTSSPALLFVNKIVRFFKCVNLRHKAPLRESWPFFCILSDAISKDFFVVVSPRRKPSQRNSGTRLLSLQVPSFEKEKTFFLCTGIHRIKLHVLISD